MGWSVLVLVGLFPCCGDRERRGTGRGEFRVGFGVGALVVVVVVVVFRKGDLGMIGCGFRVFAFGLWRMGRGGGKWLMVL